MSVWIIVGIIFLLILLGLMPTLIRRKRLELNVGIFLFLLVLILVIYIIVTEVFPFSI